MIRSSYFIRLWSILSEMAGKHWIIGIFMYDMASLAHWIAAQSAVLVVSAVFSCQLTSPDREPSLW